MGRQAGHGGREKPRIWVAGGGTGGHVYPGLAVAQALVASGRLPIDAGELEIVYVGGEDGVEKALAEGAGIRFEGVPAGGLHGMAPLDVVRNSVKLLRGVAQAVRLARRQRPAALFATGGYASVPAAVACWLAGVPILVYLPDIEPGLAVRFIGRLASRIATTVEESRRHFAARVARKVRVTGYPVRAALHTMERAAACRELSLDPEQPIVLVFGGSRGARALNQALSRDLEALLSLAQVVHISGEQEHASVARQTRSLPASAQRRYRGFDYLHRMELALAAADVAVCRAGASTLGEMPLFGLPAILVPYPHAGPNQSVNAQWLVERDAALMVEESDLSVQLLPTLTRLLTDPNTMRQMRAHMRTLARPGAAQSLADELLDLACSHLERGP